ncbi:hypothetical protein C900_01554 [Fulvivirga imtechensis AK7]|uniref:Uncharacterized protein n=1 Tax=Fulvivirga imtechensis AK7 TaxID=1237149 RepID=L8JW25_9BACT|nr:hypothetical protein C900_01554 [Fulvivirga imtechensis AK7]
MKLSGDLRKKESYNLEPENYYETRKTTDILLSLEVIFFTFATAISGL